MVCTGDKRNTSSKLPWAHDVAARFNTSVCPYDGEYLDRLDIKSADICFLSILYMQITQSQFNRKYPMIFACSAALDQNVGRVF